MPLHFRILGSGSSGNCALLRTPRTRILIDAGFSARRLSQMLAEVGESLERIDAIFFTHEHGDHTAALTGLRRLPNLPLYTNEATARVLSRDLAYRPNWKLFQTGSSFDFQDLQIRSFSIPHDASDPVGYHFTVRPEEPDATPKRLTWATDLGHAPLNVLDPIRDCDILVLEANYCPELLKADTIRPWSTKQRISGRHGHLSNPDMGSLLESLSSPHWRHVFLAHLSAECNSPAAVETTLSPLRTKLPACQFTVIPPGGASPAIDIP